MKRTLISVLLLVSLILAWCWYNSDYSNDYNDSYSDYESSQECNEPSNPYGDWWWHDAWFNRAEETGWDCDGNSESFNEWCEEYYSQLSEYEDCMN